MSCKVLLTGISGWIGKHIAIQLLNAGHEVVGTVRNKNLIGPTKETLKSKTWVKRQEKKICEKVINEVGASSVKDMGRSMGALKKNYSTVIDFSKVGIIVKKILEK